MPLLSNLEFAERSLLVRYRAHQDPQELRVSVGIEAEPQAPFAHWAMMTLVKVASRGGAGGNLFAPTDCAMRVVSGPTTDEETDACGQAYEWVLEARCIAPLFLRNMVEELRRCGFDRKVTAMSILGSAALDDSDLSVDDTTVRRWLDDPEAYLQAWGQLPFRVTLVERAGTDSDAWFRVVLAEPITKERREALELVAVTWMNASRNYLSTQGLEYVADPNVTLPSCASTKFEFRARYRDFDFCRPAGNLLLNLLGRFSLTTAKILEVELCP